MVPQAVLGTSLEVPTLSGRAELKIPAGTQPGTVFRMRGQGLPDLQGYGVGDILARLTCEVPTKLAARERELYEELAGMDRVAERRKTKGFFQKVKEYFDLG